MEVSMAQNDNREEYGDLSTALIKAYVDNKAVLVTRGGGFDCVFIPNQSDFITEISEDGIDFVQGDFIDFDNPDTYNWENCSFEVIDTNNIQIIVTRD